MKMKTTTRFPLNSKKSKAEQIYRRFRYIIIILLILVLQYYYKRKRKINNIIEENFFVIDSNTL